MIEWLTQPWVAVVVGQICEPAELVKESAPRQRRPRMSRRALSLAFVIGTVTLALVVAGRHAAAQTAPTSGGPVDAAIIEDLVAANRILAQEGIVDAYGHVSIRHPRNPNRYLLSRSVAPILVTAQDIVEYDLDSNAVDAGGRTSVLERFIHGEVYKARPDVNAVIHTHSPTVVPFSVTQIPLRPVLVAASFLWVGVPVWDIRDARDPASTGMLVRNGGLGKSLAATLGDKPVALMRGHGDVVVASNVQMAVRYAIYAEVNARMQATAIGLGGPINYISAEEGAAMGRMPGDPGERGIYGNVKPWESSRHHSFPWRERAHDRREGAGGDSDPIGKEAGTCPAANDALTA